MNEPAGLARVRSGELLYTDEVGRDACGIGGVAAKDGKPSAEVVKKALTALKCMEHRGGVCGDAGDGAGLTAALPHAFFREEAKRLTFDGARYLKSEDALAVGMFFFLDTDPAKIDAARGIVRQILSGGPVPLLGFRPVPTNEDVLPKQARDTRPGAIEQALFKVEGDPAAAERWLFLRRLELRERFAAAGLSTYVCSLSTRLVSYKGLLTCPQLADYYLDLQNPGFETGIATFHRRYSTNTFPNWTLAQPFRLTCHNGEINTVRTNRNAVSAFARGLNPPLPGGELLTPKASDSASLDEWLEYLVLEQGWSLLRAMRLSIPPVWDTEADIWGQDAFDLFTYYRRTFGSLGAWDGPAGVIGTDGRLLVGLVDRMGLRPVRWCSDKRGWLYIGSESGVFGLDNTTIVASGQLQPGQMIALDTATGERLDSYQIMGRVVAEAKKELGDIYEINRRQIVIPEGFDYTRQIDDAVGAMLAEQNWSLDHLLQAAGWDFERAVFVKDMAKLRKEPLSSMGHDRVLTVFSDHHPTLFKYLQQTFAEVTNPPIDPYREGGAMSLTTYLGRSAESTPGSAGDENLPVRQMELPSPVVSDAVIEEIRQNEVLGFKLLDATFPLSGGADALRASVVALQSAAEKAVHDGYHVLCISDKDACKRGIDPIPSLLALGAVHQYLCRQGLRDKCSLIVQAGDIQEGHDVCCLVAFGADAVHPYLMLRLVKDGLVFKDGDTKQETRLDAREALENLFAALEDTIKKVISKMGITTIEGYRGAQLFEAVGFGPELMEFLGDFPSRLGGIGFQELVEDVQWRLGRAEEMLAKKQPMGKNKDYRAFNGQVRMALRNAVKEAHPEPEQGGGEMAYTAPPADDDPAAPKRVADKFVKFSGMVNTRVPTVLRDLFHVKRAATPTPLGEIQPALDIIRNHFRGAAMSHGALTGASHMTIAAAVNELGTLSNSGEGGEARWRNDIPERAWGPFWEKVRAQRLEHPGIYTLDGKIERSRFRSRIRQIASGRFGVDAEYIVNADEMSIKMAQGAKPGEGGQLMGKKVTAEIAEIRFAKPGTDLISPPPHHDIYSIEDLAQLIYDLKAAKPGMPVSVKLVAVENIGTIAVGVAKAGADIIEIDGIDGGTGAAMVSSKEHAGLPSEMGLAEAHQALVVNGLRKSVKLRVGGGIKNGHDIIKYALFGADEFSFGQALMVSVGCIVCKSCHIPNCPTGITGSPEIFKGHPEHTKAYLHAVAEEVRQLLSQMGCKHIAEIVGRSDLLVRRTDLKAKHPRAALLDLSKFLQPDMAMTRLEEKYPQVCVTSGPCAIGLSPEREPQLGSSVTPVAGPRVDPSLSGQLKIPLNEKILAAAFDAIDTAQNADLVFRVRNSDRSVGATMAGMIARLYGREGMPNHRKIKVRLDGEAGQSFGAWCVNGLDLELRGFAQDGVAKGISGGTVVVTLDYQASDYGGEIQSVAGNNVGYGATGGTILIGGRAGHRLGIRNSGATIVAEAAGKYACEYMTRGRVLILGPVENEIGSGMTGGELFVYDPEKEAPAKLHGKSVTVIDCAHVDYEWMHPLLHQYFARTGSRQAEHILKNWAEIRRGRRLKKVLPLAVARAMEDFRAVGTNPGLSHIVSPSAILRLFLLPVSTELPPVRILLCVAAVGVLPLLALRAPSAGEPVRKPYGIETRELWTTSKVKGSPEPPDPYTMKRVYPKLKFDEALEIAAVPGKKAWAVAERPGKIYTFDATATDPEKKLVLNVGHTVYGLAFHPQFQKNGFIYLSEVPDASKETPDGSRVVRYTVDPKTMTADPKTAKLILTWPSGGHNGGCLRFGPDGMLYLSTGDSSGIADGLQTGQDLSVISGKILRIDVSPVADAPGSPAYTIPKDNPFVNTPGARGESWAYGIRQCWKISFDTATGDLWAGEVGQDLWEMVYRIEKGGNYGWSVQEGSHPFRPERKRGPTPILSPVVEHTHAEFRSITGGFVYHGKKRPELDGAYIYGDYDTGRVWMLRYDRAAKRVTEHKQLTDTTLRIVGWGQDADGEVVALDFIDGGIYQLTPAPPPSPNAPQFPRKLSETGVFASTKDHKPAAGLIPYSVNAELWSDGAIKDRFIGLPGDSKIEYETVTYPQPAPGSVPGWRFPDGTVLVKTFSLELEPGKKHRLETRLLVAERVGGTEEYGDQVWNGYTYIWNDDQTDAELADFKGEDRMYVIKGPTASRTQKWHFPSRTECTMCHTVTAKYALGVNTAQLNRDHDYGGVVANQLATLEHLGVFDRKLPKPVDQLDKLADPRDEKADLDRRARAYLHANCSHCHRKWGGGNAEFQLLYTLPLRETGILGVKPGQGNFDLKDPRLLVPGHPDRSMIYQRMTRLGLGRMPHIASNVVDEAAVKLIRRWIEGMKE